MPVTLHKQKEPVTLKEWFNENYSIIIAVLFAIQIVGLYWVGTILTYTGV